jgi:hypothetical protein
MTENLKLQFMELAFFIPIFASQGDSELRVKELSD